MKKFHFFIHLQSATDKIRGQLETAITPLYWGLRKYGLFHLEEVEKSSLEKSIIFLIEM